MRAVGFHSREGAGGRRDGWARHSGLRDGGAEPVDAGQDPHGFGSVLGEVEDLVPAAAHQGRRDLEQPRAKPFGLPLPGVVTGEGDGLHPGNKLGGELDDLAPDLVLREGLQRELQQAHVLGVTDPVLAPGAAAVPQLQDGQLSAWGVGRECGDAHALVIGDPQLRPRMRTLLAHDHPHPLGPAGKVQQPGQLRHERPVAEPVVITVIGGSPRLRLIDPFQQVRGVGGEGEPDRVGQPPCGQPLDEVLGAAGPIGADKDLLRAPSTAGEQTRWELGKSLTRHADVISGRVGAGVAGAEVDCQRFTGPGLAVVEERAQGTDAKKGDSVSVMLREQLAL